ncbi:MAG: extracellular solute-binding protein [Actinomycetales bacterium]
MVVDSWGGSFQDDQTEVIFDPFQDETGIEVVQLSDGENIYAKVEAQAGRQTGDIDLVHGDASWLERGTLSGLWAPVDEDATGAADLYEDARDTNGVGILYYSYNIVYNTEELDPGEAPRSWARGPRRGRFDIQ